MRKRKLLFTVLTLAMGAFLGSSEAMAQNGWDAIYKQTQTTSDDWTPITEGSTDGKVLGSAGTTTYYYLKKTLNFTNDRTDNGGNGNSGLKIQGTVYLYLPAGISITCRGANADGRTGAGAGIELSAGNTLYIIGGGNGTTVTAIGGNAENGRNGGNGTNATGNYSSEKVWPGRGGDGGNGGGGAGAGIGSRGGTGGTGGAGGDLGEIAYKKEANGVKGSDGSAGGTAAAMGSLYVDQTYGITVKATSGKKGTSNGKGGSAGGHFILDFASNQSVAGGAGGGGGGFGGAGCSSGIGTGGPGGGAGGGGSSGATRWKNNPGYYRVGATGGGSGMDADGSWHNNDFGSSTTMSGTQYFNNDSFEDKGEDGGTGAPDRSNGNVCGNAASNGTMNAGKKEYKIIFSPLKTDLSKDTRLKKNAQDNYEMTYSPSGATNVILPANKIGFNWVLLTYGKSCAPQGNSDSEFATASKAYYGGNGTELERTIILENVYGDLYFQEVASVCMLNSSGNNDQNIYEFREADYDVTVRLQNRTLYRDNHWNTICLPFSMTSDQIAASPLAGATIMKMNETHTGYYGNGGNIPSMNVSFDYPVLFFYFETVSTIEAGKPYLVKWTEASRWTKDGNYVDNTTSATSLSEIRHELDFSNMRVTTTTPGSFTGHATFDGSITFQGTFSSSATLKAGDKTKLMLGAGDKLYYPSKNINVGACRGYFIVPDGAAANARQIVMGFDNGETTSISVVQGSGLKDQGADTYFNLNGQRLNAPQKGINIVNGNKVIMK